MPDSIPKPRWYRLTPGRLILGLLVVECLLFLSERFQWPTWHKGYAVLIAVASVVVAMILMLLWFLVALVFRFSFQFGIRSLLTLTVAIAIPCSWLAVQMRAAKRQKEAVEAIENLGGSVEYEWQVDTNYVPRLNAQPPGPEWLRKLLGDDFLMPVEVLYFGGVSVEKDPESGQSTFVCKSVTDTALQHVKGLNKLHALYIWSPEASDAGLVNLKGLNELQDLDLYGTPVSDDGLKQLMGLNQLRQLNLRHTKVSRDGVQKLQQALPNCEIEHD